MKFKIGDIVKVKVPKENAHYSNVGDEFIGTIDSFYSNGDINHIGGRYFGTKVNKTAVLVTTEKGKDMIIDIHKIHLGAFGRIPNIDANSDIYKFVKKLTNYSGNNLSSFRYIVYNQIENTFNIEKNVSDIITHKPKTIEELRDLLENPPTTMIWKYKRGDTVVHKRTGVTGIIRKLMLTDNKKSTAYQVKSHKTNNVTKWSETTIQLFQGSEPEPVIEPEEIPLFHVDISTGFDDSNNTNYTIRSKFKNIIKDMDWSYKKDLNVCEYNPNTDSFIFHEDHTLFKSKRITNTTHFINKVKKYRNGGYEDTTYGPYMEGDMVTLVSLDKARESNEWYNNLDIPKGWGGSSEKALDLFGTTVPISKSDKTTCYINVNGTNRTLDKSFIELHITYKPILSTTTSIELTFDMLKSGMQIKFKKLEDLKSQTSSGYFIEAGFVGNMKPECGNIQTIKTINTAADRFTIEGSEWNYSKDIIDYIIGIDLTKPQETEEVPTHKYKIGDKVYRGDIGSIKYDEAIITGFYINSSKDPFYNITTLINHVSPTGWSEDYIKGIIPDPEIEEVEEAVYIEPTPTPIIAEMSVKEEITAMFPMQVLLEGPVGSGKTTVLMELAKELDLRYFAMVMTDGTTTADFKGYKNVVDGTYVGPEFRDAFENGGMYVLEELNATTSNMPIIFNTIENGYFVFADKLVYAHPDFRLCATMNTITNAKEFGGRRTLDKSVANRFHKIIMLTDFTARFTSDLLWLKEELEFVIKAEGSTNDITPRDLSRYLKFIDNGCNEITAARKALDPESIVKTKVLEDLIKRKEGH